MTRAAKLIDRVLEGTSPRSLLTERKSARDAGVIFHENSGRIQVVLFNAAGLTAALKGAVRVELPSKDQLTFQDRRVVDPGDDKDVPRGSTWVDASNGHVRLVVTDVDGENVFTRWLEHGKLTKRDVTTKKLLLRSFRMVASKLAPSDSGLKLDVPRPERVRRERNWQYRPGHKVLLNRHGKLDRHIFREVFQRYILGYVSMELNQHCDAYEVNYAAARDGFGPLIYDCAMYHAGEIGLMADRGSVSGAARKVWDFYNDKRRDVYSELLPDEGCWTTVGGVTSLDRDYVLNRLPEMPKLRQNTMKAQAVASKLGLLSSSFEQEAGNVAARFFSRLYNK
jgi:hypothetical protein